MTCEDCYWLDDCNPPVYKINKNETCDKFLDISNGGWYLTEKWIEMSYNTYKDGLLDYGEMSDWDIYLLDIYNQKKK